jgi:hypothetical protein
MTHCACSSAIILTAIKLIGLGWAGYVDRNMKHIQNFCGESLGNGPARDQGNDWRLISKCMLRKQSISVLWVVTPCGLVGRYQRCGGSCCFNLQG